MLSSATRHRFTPLAICLLCLACCAEASGATTARLGVKFAPDVAGAPSTVTITASFRSTNGEVPAPIHKSITRLPAGLGIDVTGLKTCSRATLELEEPGAGACPKASLLGAGSAFAEVGLGGTPIEEHAPVTAVLGAVSPGRTLIYFDGEGTYPITEQVIAKAILTGNPATGQTFTIEVPPIPSTVGGPSASVLDFSMSMGRQKVLSLYRHRRGRVGAVPLGIVLPKSCHGRLSFPTKLFFLRGQAPLNETPTAPCPRR